MFLSVFCRKRLVRQFYCFYLHSNQDWVSCLLLWCDAVRKQNVELFRFDEKKGGNWKWLKKVFVKHRETKLVFITDLNYFVNEHVFHKPVPLKHCSTPIARPVTTGWATRKLPIEIFKIMFSCLVQQVATILENSATSCNHFDPGKYQLVATLPIAYANVSPVWTQNILGVLVHVLAITWLYPSRKRQWTLSWPRDCGKMRLKVSENPTELRSSKTQVQNTKCFNSSVLWGDKVKHLGLLRWLCRTNIDYFGWKMRKEVIITWNFTLSQANNGLLFVSIERMTADYVGQSTFYASVGVLEVYWNFCCSEFV